MSHRSARTWLFQGKPSRYRLEDSLRIESDELWNLNQHASDVRTGDRVLIWISGANAGIYALGSVVSDPVVRPDSSTGLNYWYNPEDGVRPKPRVKVKYRRLLTDRPLLRAYLRADPVLCNMKVLRAPRGTNFEVTDHEWEAICSWLADPDLDNDRPQP